jgi:hypothetical protein
LDSSYTQGILSGYSGDDGQSVSTETGDGFYVCLDPSPSA